jgi:putative serine protease PepD
MSHVNRLPCCGALATALATLVGAVVGAAIVLGVWGGDGGTTRVLSATTTGAARPVAGVNMSSALSVNEIYRRTRQGVVDIVDTQDQGSGGVPGQSSQVEASGFVVDKRGDIATNDHVVAGATAITVTFADGTRASARVVGEDPSTDVAVIRVNVASSHLTPLTFANSSQVQTGDGVVAIGSPYGLTQTLTTGVISAQARSINAPNGATIAGALQTDAPINHGSSGGPLLDTAGDVIGMNSQIASSSGASDGVGFAISSNAVSRVAQALIGSR